MAIIDKKGRWHGRAGNLVYRTLGDQDIVQSLPKKYKQTRATRESGVEFGLGSSTACELRRALWPVYHSCDGGMANRLTQTVLRCIRGSKEKGRGERDIHDGDLSCLAGFQFNSRSPLDKMLLVRPELRRGADGQPEVRIPAFSEQGDIIRPSYECKGYTLRITASAFDYRKEVYRFLGCHDVWVGEGSKHAELVWRPQEAARAGSLVVYTVSLFATAVKQFGPMVINSREWSPAEIIGAVQVEEDVPEVQGEREKKQGAAEEKRAEGKKVGDYEKMGDYYGPEAFMKIAAIRQEPEKARQQAAKATASRAEQRRKRKKKQEEELRLLKTGPGGLPMPPEGEVKM